MVQGSGMLHLMAVLVCLLISATASGQLDSKVTVGTLAYNQGDYQKSIEALDEALASPDALKEKNIAKAYYYRAKARMGLLTKAASENNTELLNNLGDALLDSYSDYRNAERTDVGSQFTKQVQQELPKLHDQGLSMGVTYLNTAMQFAQSQPADAKQLYAHAIEYFDMAVEIDPTNYVTYDLRGQARYEQAGGTAGATAKTALSAKADFETALATYNSYPPAQPDQLLAYVYYRLALITRYHEENIGAALEHVLQGKKHLTEIQALLQQQYSNFGKEQQAALDQQYNAAMSDLNAFELDIYLNYPEKQQEAIARFEAAIQEPNADVVLFIAYASLLEQAQQLDKALAVYGQALQLDANNVTALFNLGALHNNIATDLYKRANEESNYARAQALQEAGNAALENAKVYFERVHTVDPNDITAIRALKQIYITLGDNEGFKRMKQKETNLGY